MRLEDIVSTVKVSLPWINQYSTQERMIKFVMNYIKELLDALISNFQSFVFVCSLFGVAIDCTPWIKFNPVRWTLAQFGKLLIGKRFDEMQKEMSELRNEVQLNRREQDLTRIKDLRSKILDFSNSLSKRERDLEEYEEIFDLDEEYIELLKKHDMTNGRTTRAISTISQSYEELLHRAMQISDDN